MSQTFEDGSPKQKTNPSNTEGQVDLSRQCKYSSNEILNSFIQQIIKFVSFLESGVSVTGQSLAQEGSRKSLFVEQKDEFNEEAF